MTGAITDSAALAMLADIELPAPPESQPLILVALAVMVVIAVVTTAAMAVLLRRRRLARAMAPVAVPTDPIERLALQRLATLERTWSAGGIDDREAGFRLCTLLRLGLRLAQVDGASSPPGIDDRHWRAFIARLHEIRYQPEHPPLTPALFDQARAWLARPPTPMPEQAGA